MSSRPTEDGTDDPSTIVVGVDGSPTSMRAAAYAAGLARRQNARLIAVYADNATPPTREANRERAAQPVSKRAPRTGWPSRDLDPLLAVHVRDNATIAAAPAAICATA